MLKLFLFSILILRGFSKNWPVVNNDVDLAEEESSRVDALLASLTKEQIMEIDEILHLRLITHKDTEEEEDVDHLNILSHEHFSKVDLPPVTSEELAALVKLGLSKADIEEVRELSKVMITSKETAEISNFIERASDDELMKISDMSLGELKHLVGDKKSEPIHLMNSNPKHFTRRDAEPDPEPEPEPSPREQLAGFYHSYGRKKRSPRPGFKLKLRAKLGFGKSNKGRRGGSPQRNQRRRPQHPGRGRERGRGGNYGGRGGGSYGSRNEHRGSYGVELQYGEYGRRGKRDVEVDGFDMHSKVVQVVNTLKDEQSSTKTVPIAASLSHPRKKRHSNMMDTLMKMVGIKTEQQEPPAVVYMSAVLDGQKHEVGKVENQKDSFHHGSFHQEDSLHHDALHHDLHLPSDGQEDTPPPPAYSPSESYKLAMARAKLVRLH